MVGEPPALSLGHDEKLSEVLYSCSQNKHLLLTPGRGIDVCVQESQLSFLRHATDPLSYLFPVTNTGIALTKRLTRLDSVSGDRLLQPGANGLIFPSTLMSRLSLCLRWPLRASRISFVQVHKRSFIARGLARYLLLTKLGKR